MFEAAAFFPSETSAATEAIATSSTKRASQAPHDPNEVRSTGVMVSRDSIARTFRGDKRKVFLSRHEVRAQVRACIDYAYEDQTSIAKRASEDSGATPKAAEKWRGEENTLDLTHFLNLWHNNPRFKAMARKLLFMEEGLDPDFEAALAQFMRAVQRDGGG